MPAFHVLTDSNCLLPSSLCFELGIHVVPLPFVWDGESYIDGVDIAPREFYARLRSSRSLPKTSAPTPGVFLETYRELASDNKPLLAILVGRHFSSTVTTAQLAADQRGGSDIRILDSGSNAMGLGFQVLAAARAARDGADIEEAIRIVEQMKANTGVIFAVPNLDHLRKGGRIGLAQALLGSALSMVQVLEIDNGPISPLEQVRTRSKAISRIVDIVEQRLQGAHPRRIAVLHSDAEDAAWQINQLAQARLDPDEQLMLEVSQILAIHVGPGAFGMAYSTGA